MVIFSNRIDEIQQCFISVTIKKERSLDSKVGHNSSKSLNIRTKIKNNVMAEGENCRLEEVRLRGDSWRSEVTTTRQVA
jgi:hypothetical protein